MWQDRTLLQQINQQVQSVLWGTCLKHDEGMVWSTFEIMSHYSPCRGEKEKVSMETEMEL